MSADREFLVTIAQTLREMVRPLELALDSPEAFGALMFELGWLPGEGDDPSAALGNSLDLVQRLADLEEQLDSRATNDELTIEEAGAILEDAIAIYRDVRNLAANPPAVLDAGFWTAFAEDLGGLLVTRYLEGFHPALFGALLLLGVIELAPRTAGPAATQIDYTRPTVHWGVLAELVTDPVTAVEQTYGWGGSFDHDKLLRTLHRALLAFGLRPRLCQPTAALSASYYAAGNPALETVRELRVALYSDDVPDQGWVEVGLSLMPIPPRGSTGAAPAGFMIAPYVQGKLTEQLPIGGPFVLRLSGGLESDAAAAIEVLPGSLGARLSAAATSYDLGAALVAQFPQPRIIVGDPESDRLELGDLSFGVELKGAIASPELILTLGTTSLNLVVDFANADSLVTSAGGTDRSNAGAAAALTWSSKSGLGFSGQGGLRLPIPIHLSIAGIHVDTITLAARKDSGGLSLDAGLSGGFSLGPISASVDQVGVSLEIASGAGNLHDADLQFGFKAPNGIGLAIKTSSVTGGGFLSHDADEYEGVFELAVCGVAVKAYGLINTKLPGGAPGYSALIILSAEFSPGLEIGYGFTLDGVGGLVGINRTLSVQNVQSAIWSHHFDGLLFPKDPISTAPSLMAAIGSYFPAADGRYLFGPLAKIGWGEGMVEALLGLILELPEPVRLMLIGEINVLVPLKLPQLELHIDFDGGVDFGQKLAFFDASLHNSKIERYPITGDLAFRYGWGDQPVFALSIGGFNPHFQPPANFPALKRLTVTIGSTGAQLVAQAYFALTSNTLQFGAKVELTAGTGSFNVHGWLGFDALVEWNPFAFIFDLSAGVELRHNTSVLASVHLDGQVSGTSPWHVSGDASISCWFFDISVHFDKSWGDAAAALPATDPMPAVRAALGNAGAWTSTLAPSLRAAITAQSQPSDAGGAVLLDPAGALRVAQRVVPLGEPITRFGGTPLGRTLTVGIDSLTVLGNSSWTATTEEFAPAQFQEMSDAQKLSLPSFTRLAAGAEIGGDRVDLGQSARLRSVATSLGYDTTIIDSVSQRPGAPYALNAVAQLAMNGRLTPAPTPPPKVTLPADHYVIAGTADLKTRADLAGDGTKRGALAALAAYLAATPAAHGQLQVVLSSEAA